MPRCPPVGELWSLCSTSGTICGGWRSYSRGWVPPPVTYFYSRYRIPLVPQGSEVCASSWNFQRERVWMQPLGSLLNVRILLLHRANLYIEDCIAVTLAVHTCQHRWSAGCSQQSEEKYAITALPGKNLKSVADTLKQGVVIPVNWFINRLVGSTYLSSHMVWNETSMIQPLQAANCLRWNEHAWLIYAR